MIVFYLVFYKIGIVRGVDTFKGLLYVITPVPLSTLEKVDLFLQGFIQIPTGLLQVIVSYHLFNISSGLDIKNPFHSLIIWLCSLF